MIISHKYKFIFIKTRKTAGTSIEYNLSKYLGENDIITPSASGSYLSQNFLIDTSISKIFFNLNLNRLSKIFKKKFNEHSHAIDVKKIIGKNIFNNYYKFCVEREPVDKCISYYFMRKNSPKSNIRRKHMTWSDFVRKKNFPVDNNFYTHKNKIIVDKILRYENLDAEITTLLKNLGLQDFKLEKNVNNTFREKNLFVSEQEKMFIYNEFKSSLNFAKYNYNIT